MRQGCIVVLDVGKTLAKLTIWSREGRLIGRRTRFNAPAGNAYTSLDVEGVTGWLADTLSAFAAREEIAAIVPVGHGAGACVVDEGGLALPPLDYEFEMPADAMARYEKLRDPFALTGSPRLPGGLNLGAQLFWLEETHPQAMARGRIVTWPQYWAWLLSGVAATEVTSLGCHTDLWVPGEGRPSPLAVKRGWAERLAPLRRAGDVLGPVTEEWRKRCNLPVDCAVLCGLHDSNAAFLAVRLYPEIGAHECTVLSTGTWFVAMRAAGRGTAPVALPEGRDCLVNVDAAGVPVPSARFMGGREAEYLEAAEGAPVDPARHADELLQRAARAVAEGVLALPTFQRGVGPFPGGKGRWIGGRPDDPLMRRAVAGLYLALVADMSLDLIGSEARLVVEGRFACDPVFARALAALRPQQSVYLSQMQDNVSFGALRLVEPDLPPPCALVRAEPFQGDLKAYAKKWRAGAEAGARAFSS